MDVYEFMEYIKDCGNVNCDGIECCDCPIHADGRIFSGCVLNRLVDCVKEYEKSEEFTAIITIGDTPYGVIDYRIPNDGELILREHNARIAIGRITQHHILKEITE